MKVLFFSQYFHPEEFRANDIVRGLLERGHEVTVVTGLPNYPEGRFFKGYGLFTGPYREKWNGVTIIRMPLLPRGSSDKRMLAINYLSFMLFAALLAPFRLRIGYDVVFCWMASPITQVFPAWIAKKINAAPLVLWVMDLWPDSLSASGQVKNKTIVRITGHFTRWLYRKCDLILAQSRSFAPHISKTARTTSDQIVYLPQWEPRMDDATVVDSSIPALPDGFRIVFTGNIGNSQDFRTIVAAADLLRDCKNIHWIIVGDGQAFERTRVKVQALGLEANFHLFGRFPIEAMPRFYSEADVLLATLRPAEIFSLTIPTKILSYLAAGVPLITAIDGEVADIINESGAGFAVPAGNPQCLADAVYRMTKLPKAERAEMGCAGRQYYLANFDREKLLTQLCDNLQAAVDAIK